MTGSNLGKSFHRLNFTWPLLSDDEQGGSGSTWVNVAPDQRFHFPDFWPGTWKLTTDLDGREVSTTAHISPHDTAVSLEINVGE